MEEQEAPLEDVHEEIHHHAEHARERWVSAVALSTALLATLAAIASLFSGDNVNEAVLEQIQASDKWAYFQADGIKAIELQTRIHLLESADKKVDPEDRKRLEEYRSTRDELKRDGRELEASSQHHMARHHLISKSVTFSQIAIAVSAISVLTRRRWFWGVGIAFGGLGLGYLIAGLLR